MKVRGAALPKRLKLDLTFANEVNPLDRTEEQRWLQPSLVCHCAKICGAECFYCAVSAVDGTSLLA